MADSTKSNSEQSRTLDYLRLLRIPNVFTAIADIMMGFAFASAGGPPFQALLLLIPSSCCLYLAGMVLNDVFDYEVDRVERPDRPLPSGRITPRRAAWIGAGLLLAGVLFAWSTGLLQDLGVNPAWRPGIIATLLALMVLLYDGGAKRTPFGPLAMGGCRLLNVLLGMSVDPRLSTIFGFSGTQWLVASGMGVYVSGITWFARHEAKTSRRASLFGAVALMMAGVALLASFPFLSSARTRLTHNQVWPILLLLLTVPVWRRCFLATANPIPENVQAAVKQAIMALIVLNAALSITVAGTWYGLAVLCLLGPSMLLGRWVYST